MPYQIFPCRALMIRAVPNISLPCHAWYQDLGTRILVPRSQYQDLGTRILVPRSWYQYLGTRSWFQDLGTKKNGELERQSLTKIEQGGRGGCSPPARGSGGLEAGSPPGTAGGLGGGSPPVKTILWHHFSCNAMLCYYFFPCQYFPCRALPRFSVPCRAINMLVHGCVPCQGVPVFYIGFALH